MSKPGMFLVNSGIYEHGNHTWICTKTICTRSPERGDLCLLEKLQWFTCGEKAIRLKGPINQAIWHYIMGNYVFCMKSKQRLFC